MNDTRVPHGRNSPPPDSGLPPASGSKPCSGCADAMQSGNKFCPRCGRKVAPALDPRPTPPVDRAAPPDQPIQRPAETPLLPLVGPSAPVKAVCQVCGTDLSCNARFCSHCGVGVGNAPPRVRLRRRGSRGNSAPLELHDSETLLGKGADCGVAVPDDDYVSRRHARLFRSNGLLFLEDLGSSNGTFLRVRRPVALEDGDEIVIGTTVFVLEDGQPC